MPVSGAWRLTYSLQSWVESGEENDCYLYLNGQRLSAETLHTTYTESGGVWSTGGRVVTLEASAADTIELRTITMNGSYRHIIFCAEYISKM